MKINLLIGVTAIAMISSMAYAGDREGKAYSSGAYSSAGHGDHKTRGSLRDDSTDGPTDEGRNPDDNGDEIYRPNNDGTRGTDESRGDDTMGNDTSE